MKNSLIFLIATLCLLFASHWSDSFGYNRVNGQDQIQSSFQEEEKVPDLVSISTNEEGKSDKSKFQNFAPLLLISLFGIVFWDNSYLKKNINDRP